MLTPKMIAGVVVLYNPGEEVLDCIKSYSNQIDKLYAVDNSEVSSPFLDKIKDINNVEYLTLNGNLGIAKALNIGAEKAIAEDYSFLLTMDQDSKAAPDMVANLIAAGMSLNSKIGILSPFHSIAVQPAPDPKELECNQVLTAWTSGSLLNLDAFKTVGPFEESYFIDFVDHEYCMRLNLAGYKIFKITKAVLHHNIGHNTHKRKFLWFDLIASNHSPLRRYYITRNRFDLASRMSRHFPDFFWDDRRAFLAEIVTILFFEKEKVHKFLMILRGYLDFKKSSFGKYSR